MCILAAANVPQLNEARANLLSRAKKKLIAERGEEETAKLLFGLE